MKKIKHFLLIFTIISVLLGLCACKLFKKDKNNDKNEGTVSTEEVENLIYGKDTELSLIVTNSDIDEIVIADFYNSIFAHNNNVKLHMNTLPEKAEHEIIIGPSDREITKRAYEVLSATNMTSSVTLVTSFIQTVLP